MVTGQCGLNGGLVQVSAGKVLPPESVHVQILSLGITDLTA